MTNSNYQIIITTSPDTNKRLIDNGYYLYGFGAIQSTDKTGLPVVWFQNQISSTQLLVEWSDQYQVFTSPNSIRPKDQITASFSTNINLGQTLSVSVGGIGQVINKGSPNSISIINTISDQFTWGVSQMLKGIANPVCALPLYGKNLDVITPLKKVLLLFSNNQVKPGTMLNYFENIAEDIALIGTQSEGILIDMIGTNQRTVSYDINTGWDWGDFSWAQHVPANSSLIQLLIEIPPSTLATS